MDKKMLQPQTSSVKKKKSLQNKLLMLVIGMMLTLAICIGVFSLASANTILHNNAKYILSATCTSESEHLNSILVGIRNSVEIMESHILHELKHIEQLNDEEFLEQYTKEMDDLFAIIAENTTETVAYYLRYNPKITHSTAGFFYSKERTSGKLEPLPVTDLSLYDESEIEHVGWYYEPIKAGHAIWMEPYYNKNNGYTMISYVIPLYKDGILFGVVGMDVDFEVLTRTAAGIEVYGDGCAHLLDKEKQTIYEAGSHDEKTTNFIEAVSKLENDMYMMLSADYFKIQRVGIHIMLLIFGIFIVVMTAAIIFTIMATRKIVRPIEKLTMATQDLVKGEIIDYLDLNSNDEIGILAKAFSETSKQLRSQIDYINELAYKDSLTGLKNSTAYIEKTKELDITMKTEELRFGLIVADINNLKLINDRYGHEMGNDLISATAKVLTEAFENLNVYRIGGDEFAVILVKDELDCIDHYLSKFDRLCSKAAITTPDKDFYISVSRGISIYEPKTDKTFEDVFSRADHNMYIYKQLAKTADTSNK